MCPAGCGQVVGPNTKTCPNKACGADVALLREKAGVKAIRAQKASQLPGDAVSSISKAALKAHARCMESAAQQAFSQQLQAFTDPPYGATCARRQSCKYAAFMVPEGLGVDQDGLPRPAYLSTIAPTKQKRALARLRLSAAPIQTNQTHAVPFLQRRCTRCNRGVDTEHHLLFDCPALASTRAEFQSSLPLASRSMRALMSGVYDGDRVSRILAFVSRMIEAIPGPTA